MNFENARFNMVAQQIRPWDVLDFDVLDLFMTVPREEFVPAAYKTLAFADVEIPISANATLFKPVVEGKILQQLKLKPEETVLEIGTGTGFFAALMAKRVKWVRSIEIDPELVKMANDNLKRCGVENVKVKEGDGAQGWPQRAPYDVIVISGSLPVVPPVLLEQIKPGGRLFAFVGEGPAMQGQLISCVAKGEFKTEITFESSVAPIQNAVQDNEFWF